MRRFLWRAGFLVLVYAIVLHLGWAIVMLTTDDILKTTPTAFLLELVGQHWSGIIYLFAAQLAVVGLLFPGFRGLVCCLPQNALLFLAASTGIGATITGVYPDGVVRSSPFIFVDQWPMILVAVLHAASLIAYHGRHWSIPEPNGANGTKP
jgi:hypothetical protein